MYTVADETLPAMYMDEIQLQFTQTNIVSIVHLQQYCIATRRFLSLQYYYGFVLLRLTSRIDNVFERQNSFVFCLLL